MIFDMPPIHVDTELREITVNGRTFKIDVVAMMADPNPRLLWRFVEEKDGTINATAYDESEVIWIDTKQ